MDLRPGPDPYLAADAARLRPRGDPVRPHLVPGLPPIPALVREPSAQDSSSRRHGPRAHASVGGEQGARDARAREAEAEAEAATPSRLESRGRPPARRGSRTDCPPPLPLSRIGYSEGPARALRGDPRGRHSERIRQPSTPSPCCAAHFSPLL